MRRLNLDLDEISVNTSDTLLRLSRSSPGGVLFPKLEWLRWDVDEVHTLLPFFRLFLSPHLKRVTLCTDIDLPSVPSTLSTLLVQIISSLPTSVENMSLMCGQGRWRDEPLENAISSFVCRCGPWLRRVGTRVPISEAALHHLMLSPNLSSWRTAQGPPRVVSTSIFPSLERLRLDEQAALPWLHLLTSREMGTLQNGSATVTSDANIKGSLKSLYLPANTIVDSTLLSSITKFRNLITVHVRTYHFFSTESCTFHLTDDDMENLASALPRLNILRLGEPCCGGSCNTTVASLMSVSVHCLDLEVLETHRVHRRVF